MEYLDKVLGIKVTYKNGEFAHLPNFIATRYRLQMVSMNGQRVIFLYPKTELEQIEVLKKHIARIQKNENLPVVLVLNALSFRQKAYLIREKIPFIVEGKQIYLLFMAMYLQERCNAERKPREEILPSAQMLLLHFIYGGTRELSTSQAAKDLELTPTSISRASKQLEEMGLLHIKKVGVQRILQSEDSPKILFQKAGDKLLNGVEVYFVNDGIWTMDGDGEVRLTIMASIAQDESRKTSERVKAGQKISRENGVLYGTGNVLGYDLDKVNKTYTINEEQADTVRRIYELYANGYGETAVTNMLMAEGRKDGGGGCTWTASKVSRVLRKPVYKGYKAYNQSCVKDYLSQERIFGIVNNAVY